MKPFSRRTVEQREHRVFNYRLSRARRSVECSFGLLTSKFRLFRRAIIADVNKIVDVIKAAVCIHNFILDRKEPVDMSNKEFVEKMRRNYNKSIFNRSFNKFNSKRQAAKYAINVRRNLAYYFAQEGQVPWQWNKI